MNIVDKPDKTQPYRVKFGHILIYALSGILESAFEYRKVFHQSLSSLDLKYKCTDFSILL